MLIAYIVACLLLLVIVGWKYVQLGRCKEVMEAQKNELMIKDLIISKYEETYEYRINEKAKEQPKRKRGRPRKEVK